MRATRSACQQLCSSAAARGASRRYVVCVCVIYSRLPGPGRPNRIFGSIALARAAKLIGYYSYIFIYFAFYPRHLQLHFDLPLPTRPVLDTNPPQATHSDTSSRRDCTVCDTSSHAIINDAKLMVRRITAAPQKFGPPKPIRIAHVHDCPVHHSQRIIGPAQGHRLFVSNRPAQGHAQSDFLPRMLAFSNCASVRPVGWSFSSSA